MNGKQSGSVTVFMGMTVMVLLSLFFTLAETLRYLALEQCALLTSVRTEESMAAMFNRVLWEEYGILGLDMNLGMVDAGDGVFSSACMQRLENNGNPEFEDANFLRVSAKTCILESYTVYTDQNGVPFIKAGAIRAAETIPKELLTQWSEDSKAAEEAIAAGKDPEELISTGENALKNQEEAPAEEGEPQTEVSEELRKRSKKYEDCQNPMQMWKSIKGRGMLGLVLPPEKAVSTAEADLSDTVSHRINQAGKGNLSVEKGVLDKLLFDQFILTEIGCFRNAGKHKGLSYGAEYVLCGKASDRENLEGTLLRLFGLREAVNIASLYQDTARMSEAEAFAVAIAGVTANPAVIEAVKVAILAVWAMVESVLDLRLMMEGGKAALIKTPAEWTSELIMLPTYLFGYTKANPCEGGITYEGYLRMLLLLLPERTLAYRAMDTVEISIRLHEDYPNIRMDRMLCRSKTRDELVASPLFFSFVPQLQGRMSGYEFREEGNIDYL